MSPAVFMNVLAVSAWVAAGLASIIAFPRLAGQRGRKSPLARYAALILLLLSAIPVISVRSILEDPRAWTLAALLSSAVSFGGLLLLPRKAVRHPGPRRVIFPYRAVGIAILAVSVPVLLVSGFAFEKWDMGFRILRMAFISGLASLWIGWRASAPGLEQVLAKDSRRPVMYLRNFAHEEQVFVAIPRHPERYYPITPSSEAFSAQYASFEEYFAETMRQQLGPLIALGNPSDFVPPPGAARAYLHDATWKEEFAALVEGASCIIALPDDSESLRWEFEFLGTKGLAGKLFLFLPPDLEDRKDLRGIRRAGHAIWRTILLADGSPKNHQRIKLTSWSSFAAMMNRIGFSVDEANPGPGTVIGFDAHARAIVIRTGARTSWEYVDAMKSWLDENAVAGRSAATHSKEQ